MSKPKPSTNLQEKAPSHEPCASPELSPRCGIMRAVYISCHMMMRVFDRALQPEGLTGSRWHLLIVVRDAQTPLTITQLSECLFLSPQNVSRMIASLETDGLVSRDATGPGRTVRVRLTETGHARVETCAELAERCAEQMFEGIALDEIAQATGVLERMMANTGAFEKSLEQILACTPDGTPGDRIKPDPKPRSRPHPKPHPKPHHGPDPKPAA